MPINDYIINHHFLNRIFDPNYYNQASKPILLKMVYHLDFVKAFILIFQSIVKYSFILLYLTD